MEINNISESYINISGNIYDSEFVNLANVRNDKISFDDKALFLTKEKKELLNSEKIKKINDVIYIFKHKECYGIICDIPIKEYNEGKIKCHELIIKDTVLSMLSNLHYYNCEVAPVLLAHKRKANYLSYIESKSFKEYFTIGDIEIYAFCGREARKIADEFSKINDLYVADGHHRLYVTSLSNFKTSVLSCVISFEYLNIFPIYRVIHNLDVEILKKAAEFIKNKFDIFPSETPLSKGKISIKYNDESFIVKLIDLKGDDFWNNDIYRLNTQIISQAFRIFDNGNIKYLSHREFNNPKLELDNKDVLIEMYPVEKYEFIKCVDNKFVMPPKSTCFIPKFPSFLVFKKYK
ncbi:hypothetical protein N494_12925 [Clostridium botulinum A2B7 92]|uniref:DUF1015 family protein n=1 Tax=Clostridium botulinum TaxID=1491 RepID=UPI0007E16A25|nr:DUF1015 family protein [Clostridium botulinum]KEI97162.1 hypothetical protein N494_12925 [Clostridium botulinum A2B7 92]